MLQSILLVTAGLLVGLVLGFSLGGENSTDTGSQSQTQAASLKAIQSFEEKVERLGENVDSLRSLLEHRPRTSTDPATDTAAAPTDEIKELLAQLQSISQRNIRSATLRLPPEGVRPYPLPAGFFLESEHELFKRNPLSRGARAFREPSGRRVGGRSHPNRKNPPK